MDVLSDFYKTQKFFLPELNRLVENGEFHEAGQRAHALKGAAGNISAVKLYHTVVALEKACVRMDMKETKQFLEKAKNEIELVFHSIETLSQPNQNRKFKNKKHPTIALITILLKSVILSLNWENALSCLIP
jgi:HPt (histidine-containing phosphotransfer) domain-containing protein